MARPASYSRAQETFLLSKAKPQKGKRVCASDLSDYSWLRQEQCIQYYKLPKDVLQIRSSRDVVRFLKDTVSPGDRQQESLWVICVDVKNRPIALSEPFRGGRDTAAIDMGVLLQGVVLSGAIAFVMAHNHPSGDPGPSDADDVITKRVREASKIMGVQLLDHVIVVGDSDDYFSYLDTGRLMK